MHGLNAATSSTVQGVYTFSRSHNCGKVALMCTVNSDSPELRH